MELYLYIWSDRSRRRARNNAYRIKRCIALYTQRFYLFIFSGFFSLLHLTLSLLLPLLRPPSSPSEVVIIFAELIRGAHTTTAEME